MLGEAGQFPFICPGVDSSKEAVLQLTHRGSQQALTFPDPQPDGGLEGLTPEHPVRINGQQPQAESPVPIAGRSPLWNTRLLPIPPHLLRRENVLRIETKAMATGSGLDNFTVDNVRGVVQDPAAQPPGPRFPGAVRGATRLTDHPAATQKENIMKRNKLSRKIATSSMLGLVVTWAQANPPRPDAEVVIEWNEILQSVLPAGGLAPPRHYAMMHVAMFDAVN